MRVRSLGAAGASGYRRIDQVDAALARGGGPDEQRRLRHRAVDGDHGIWRQLRQQAVRAVQQLTDVRLIAHAHPDDAAALCELARPAARARSERGQFRERGGIDVVDPQLLSELQELARHGFADVAEADETDAHACCPAVLMSATPTRASWESVRSGALRRTPGPPPAGTRNMPRSPPRASAAAARRRTSVPW